MQSSLYSGPSDAPRAVPFCGRKRQKTWSLAERALHLAGIGPYLNRQIPDWSEHPPDSEEAIPEIRQNFPDSCGSPGIAIEVSWALPLRFGATGRCIPFGATVPHRSTTWQSKRGCAVIPTLRSPTIPKGSNLLAAWTKSNSRNKERRSLRLTRICEGLAAVFAYFVLSS